MELGAGAVRVAPGRLRVLLVLIGIYAALAAVQRPATFAELFLNYLTLASCASYLVVSTGLVMALLSRKRGNFRQIVAAERDRFAFGLAVISLFAIGLAAFSTHKLLIPTTVPFVWDGAFDAIDRLLHGTAPWELTHAVLSAPIEQLIGTLYGMPWFLYWFGTLGYVAFCGREPLRSRYLWAMALTFGLLGTLAATVFASHGPIFFPQFGLGGYDGLIEMLGQTEIGRDMLGSADYLYGAYASGEARFGSGISAMPSMHVATVTLNLCFYATLNRRLGMAALVPVLLIGIGSVHFGWHYAVDAYASLAAVPLIWWLAGRLSRQ